MCSGRWRAAQVAPCTNSCRGSGLLCQYYAIALSWRSGGSSRGHGEAENRSAINIITTSLVTRRSSFNFLVIFFFGDTNSFNSLGRNNGANTSGRTQFFARSIQESDVLEGGSLSTLPTTSHLANQREPVFVNAVQHLTVNPIIYYNQVARLRRPWSFFLQLY